jgi:DnaJ-class molecular chaperone
MDYYGILGIDSKATHLEIKKRYLFLALKYHPDRNKHLPLDEYLENENYFKTVTRAYTILSDSDERKKYDSYYHSQSHSHSESHSHTNESFFYSYFKNNINFTVSSRLFNIASKIFSQEKIQSGQDFYNTFSSFLNNRQTYDNINDFIKNYTIFINKKNNERIQNLKTTNTEKNTEKEKDIEKDTEKEKNTESKIEPRNVKNSKVIKNKKSEDLVYNVNVSLADIFNEVPKELKVARIRICNMCSGRGFMGFAENMSLCHICNGIMKIVEHKNFQIDIREHKLIFYNEGHQMNDINEDPSDLVINIFSKPDDRFERLNEYDLILHQDITLYELYTQKNIEFEQLNNNIHTIQYIYSKDILNDLKIIVPNLGLPIGSSGNRGELHIKLNLILPEREQLFTLANLE